MYTRPNPTPHAVAMPFGSGNRTRPVSQIVRGRIPFSLVGACSFLMAAIGLTTPLEFPWDPDKVTTDAHVALIEHGSAGREAAVVLIGLVSLFILYRSRPLRFQRPSFLSWAVLTSVGLTTVSVLWADDTYLALKRIFVYLLLSLAVLALAAALSYYQLAIWATVGCSAVLLLAIGTDLVVGRFAPFDPDYRLAGVLQPNDLGQYCALLLLSTLYLLRQGHHRRLVAVCLLVAVLCLCLTRSLTSSASAVGAALFLFALVSPRRLKALALVGVAVAVTSAALLSFHLSSDTVMELEHSGPRSDSTFVTRVELWQEAAEYVRERPVLGFGYGGFWTPARESRVASDQGWNLGSAHSEYVEMALEFGLLGPTLYLSILIAAITSTIRRYRRTPQPELLLVATTCVWMLITSATESMELGPVIPVLVFYALLFKLAFFPLPRSA